MLRIRVGIFDQCPTLRLGIRAVLNHHQDIEVTCEAAESEEVLHQIDTYHPDVLILGISYSRARIEGLIRELQQRHPSLQIVVFGDSWEGVKDILQVGVLGYVLKTEQPDALAKAVRTVVRGETWVSPTLLSDLISNSADGSAALANLSEREEEMLHCLARGYDNQKIMAKMRISRRTVRFHLENIYRKLGVKNRYEAIVWAVKQGYGENERRNLRFKPG